MTSRDRSLAVVDRRVNFRPQRPREPTTKTEIGKVCRGGRHRVGAVDPAVVAKPDQQLGVVSRRQYELSIAGDEADYEKTDIRCVLPMHVTVVDENTHGELWICIYPHRDICVSTADYSPIHPTPGNWQRRQHVVINSDSISPSVPFFVLVFKRAVDECGDRLLYEKLGVGWFTLADLTPTVLVSPPASKSASQPRTKKEEEVPWGCSVDINSNVTGAYTARVFVRVWDASLATRAGPVREVSLYKLNDGKENKKYTHMPDSVRAPIYARHTARVVTELKAHTQSTSAHGTDASRTARYPSGAPVDMKMFDVFLNARKLPIMLYYASSMFIDIQNADALVTQMIYLACIQNNITPEELRGKLQELSSTKQGEQQLLFQRKFLVDTLRAFALLLTYAPDTEGENFQYVWQTGEFAYAQCDCEELTAMCMLAMRIIALSECALASELRVFARRFVFCATLMTSKAGDGSDTMHMSGALYPRQTLYSMANMTTKGNSDESREPRKIEYEPGLPDGSSQLTLEPLVVDAMVNLAHEPLNTGDYSIEADVSLTLLPLRSLQFMTSRRLFDTVVRLYAVDVALPAKDPRCCVEYVPFTISGPNMTPGLHVSDFYRMAQTCYFRAVSVHKTCIEALKHELNETLYFTCLATQKSKCLTEAQTAKLVTDGRLAATRMGSNFKFVRTVLCMRVARVAETTNWAARMARHNKEMKHHKAATTGALVYIMNNVVAYPYYLIEC